MLKDLGLEPVVSRVTLQESIYQRMSQALMTGLFDPGQTLTISALADLFGTSHMPVREALRRLAAENAVEVASTGSAFVPGVSLERLNELSSARIIVEGAASGAAAIAVRRDGDNFLRKLELNVANHLAAAQTSDIPAMLAHNQEFHFAIYKASGSKVLMQLITTLWLQYGPYLSLLTKHIGSKIPGNEAERYVEHHYAIISALKKGDADTVSRYTTEDIQSTQNLLQTLCSEGIDGKFMESDKSQEKAAAAKARKAVRAAKAVA